MIEDLAVVGNVHRTGFVCHRLMPARHVDDAQPLVAEKCCAIFIHTVSVRAAMRDRVHHPPQIGGPRASVSLS